MVWVNPVPKISWKLKSCPWAFWVVVVVVVVVVAPKLKSFPWTSCAFAWLNKFPKLKFFDSSAFKYVTFFPPKITGKVVTLVS